MLSSIGTTLCYWRLLSTSITGDCCRNASVLRCAKIRRGFGARRTDRRRQAAEEPASESQAGAEEIWMAATKMEALAAFGGFVETWGVKYDKAV
jgi:hypothetical protein